ncbi:MAG: hypothetical protein HMLKMBBP_03886 [Planctomycetes bacterium]|nr:hypothetical protein [Planctomycetota bacterium]
MMPRTVNGPSRALRTAVVTAAAAGLAGGAFAVTEKPDPLVPGRPVRGIEARAGVELVFRIDVPEGVQRMRIRTQRGRGDCDLFVRGAAHPSRDEYDDVSAGRTTRESLLVKDPEAGAWYAMLSGFEAFKDVTLSVEFDRAAGVRDAPRILPGPGVYVGDAPIRLRPGRGRGVVRFTTDGSAPDADSPAADGDVVLAADARIRAVTHFGHGAPSRETAGDVSVLPPGTVTVLQSGVAAVRRCGFEGSRTMYRIDVPEGLPMLRVSTSGGEGDTSVRVRRGEYPTAELADGADDGKRNRAFVSIPAAEAGAWFIAVDAKSDYAGMQVRASVAAPQPDLIVDRESLRPYFTIAEFKPSDCDVVEGLVLPGRRSLMRFSTTTVNVGGADLHMGLPTPDNPLFVFHECHGHYHFNGFASYRLLDLEGGVAATGIKVSFCLEDVIRDDPDAPEDARYHCLDQGIQAGWADVYDSGLPGQWVDVTGVPPGDYLLEISVNPDRVLEESDYTNNATTLPVRVPAE